MLTRLQVSGFKSLVDASVRFGPFTCIAGPNGSGKSNLFDAIAFLRELSERPLLEAALSVREAEGESDPLSLFHRAGQDRDQEMRFEAEMIVPPTGVDDLGQEAEASSTFLRYQLCIGRRRDDPQTSGGLEVRNEVLEYITVGDASAHMRFPRSRAWGESVLQNKRRAGAYISTEREGGVTHVKLHQEGVAGRPRQYLASNLPRTVLSTVNALESPTALLARREMQSWRLLQLEPSALRRPDAYRDPARIAADGAHVPATLARLARLRPGHRSHVAEGQEAQSAEAERAYAAIANRLALLIDGVGSVRVDDDPRRELLTVVLRERDGSEHPARSLSDGTLRFLALATMELDPEARGVLCLEEPENGIHPERIPAMLRLLGDLAVDVEQPAGPDNPLRQVIVNTHSPAVVARVPDHSLLGASLVPRLGGGGRFLATTFEWLPETWRSQADPDVRTLSKGRLLSYLNPHGIGEQEGTAGGRVIDRPDLQMLLPFEPSQPPS